MSEICLYHGSNHIIEHPTFGVGNPRNDYGLGFYCTQKLEIAFEWAVGHGTDGHANVYQLQTEGLRIVNLNSADYCSLHWLTVLLENRTFDIRSPLALESRDYLTKNFHVDLSQADIIEGYRADDSYFSFAQDFISGAISYRQLQNAMQLGQLGLQVVVKSPRAFERLQFVEAKKAPKDVWLPQREARDRDARHRYFDAERSKRERGDLFITQIIDEEIGAGDARL